MGNSGALTDISGIVNQEGGHVTDEAQDLWTPTSEEIFLATRLAEQLISGLDLSGRSVPRLRLCTDDDDLKP